MAKMKKVPKKPAPRSVDVMGRVQTLTQSHKHQRLNQWSEEK